MSKKEKDESLEQEKKDEKIEIEYVVDKKKSRKTKRDDIEALKKKLKKTHTEIKKLTIEMEKLKEEYLRQLADKENLRKRLEREKSEFYDYALNELLKDFLLVLDNFERALESQDQENGKSFREGIEMIHKQYRDILLKQGITPIEIIDKKFDPQFHQAFMSEESEEVDEPEVAEVLQKGYMLHNRLLRPTLVKVIVPKKGE